MANVSVRAGMTDLEGIPARQAFPRPSVVMDAPRSVGGAERGLRGGGNADFGVGKSAGGGEGDENGGDRGPTNEALVRGLVEDRGLDSVQRGLSWRACLRGGRRSRINGASDWSDGMRSRFFGERDEAATAALAAGEVDGRSSFIMFRFAR